jgi:hypothetical protein
LRSVKSLERLSKEQSNNQATDQSGTVDFFFQNDTSFDLLPECASSRAPSSGILIRYRISKTVNGVKARGGSINSMAPLIAGGVLYITSGYAGNASPGDVLLAFSVDGK